MDGLAGFVLSIIPFLIPIPIIWARANSKKALNIYTPRKIALFSFLTGGFWSIGIVSLADKLIPSASEGDRIVLYETRLMGWTECFSFASSHY